MNELIYRIKTLRVHFNRLVDNFLVWSMLSWENGRCLELFSVLVRSTTGVLCHSHHQLAFDKLTQNMKVLHVHD